MALDRFDDASEARAEANARAERTGEDQFVYQEYSAISKQWQYRVDDRNLLENCIYSVRGVDALYDALTGKEPNVSEPMPNYDQPVHSAINEIISAMSALNMAPDPETDEAKLEAIREQQGVVYISQSDRWVQHSMEHLRTAVGLLHKAQGLAKQLT